MDKGVFMQYISISFNILSLSQFMSSSISASSSNYIYKIVFVISHVILQVIILIIIIIVPIITIYLHVLAQHKFENPLFLLSTVIKILGDQFEKLVYQSLCSAFKYFQHIDWPRKEKKTKTKFKCTCTKQILRGLYETPTTHYLGRGQSEAVQFPNSKIAH